jgi:aspartyl protease family protein
MPVAAPEPAAPPNGRSVIVFGAANGNFYVHGTVNSRRTDFMVDTGASVVALSDKDADALGIRPRERDFTATVQTANGLVRAARVNLDSVQIGDLTVRDVAAIVLPDGALRDNLLGLSFLKRLRHFEYGNGKLVLEN